VRHDIPLLTTASQARQLHEIDLKVSPQTKQQDAPARLEHPAAIAGIDGQLRSIGKRFRLLFWLAPALLLLGIFTYLPILLEFGLSFFTADGFSPPKWSGLGNYWDAIHDVDFWTALLNNGWYAVWTVTGKVVLALAIASLLNQKVFGGNFLRSVFFLPVVLSFVAIGIIWTLIYNYDYGIINGTLSLLGLQWLRHDWLGSPETAFGAVVLVDLWKWTGFHIVIYLAGLQSIPQDLYEAAALDGASVWQRFWKITVPLLKPFTAINVLLASLGALSVFDLVYVMTQGGPVKATDVVMIEVYNQAFQFNRLGYAAAMSAIMLVLIMVISVTVLRAFGQKLLARG
jgi:ABC-type sugar transport system permease subunit